ncbi:DoxX family protein [Ktedonosporobacter rubrisoli]|uniref:DoxX family protein n=2 Tax=Ktedonosporobacter rubrisoli TaxID=2509675 RepID=A0A4P6JKQ7_KTERU|nr:DoxX family protein [Ktedonosporobacter rubrisoli]
MSMISRADNMNRLKVIGYWTATAIIAFELILGGIMALVHGRNMLIGEPLVEVMQHLGYPIYLLTILGVCKPLAGIILLVPGLPRLKEWAYAGSFVSLLGALVSDALRGNEVYAIFALGFTILTLASWALRPQNRILGTLPTWPTLLFTTSKRITE